MATLAFNESVMPFYETSEALFAEVYLDPSQIFRIKLLARIVNSFQLLKAKSLSSMFD